MQDSGCWMLDAGSLLPKTAFWTGVILVLESRVAITRNDLLHLLHNPLAVAARPVNPAATIATTEPGCGLEHVRGRQISDIFTRDIDEHAITLGAPRVFQSRVGPKIEASEDLHQLSIEFLRPNQVRSRPGGSEFTVFGQ
jgi:hypothetical protein